MASQAGAGAEVYDQRYSEGTYRQRLTGHETARADALRHFITRVIHTEHASSVLDYGAGTGLFLPLWTSVFTDAQLTFCDISSIARDKFCEKYPAHAAAYRDVGPGGADCADNTFDVIVSVEVMEHVPDLEGYMSDIFRLLKPGGTFIWTTPCANAWSIEHVLSFVTRTIDGTREGYRRWRWEDETHVRRLKSREAAAVLRRCGFDNIRFRFRAHVFSFLCSNCPPTRRFRRLRTRLMKLDYSWFRSLPNGASMLGAATKPHVAGGGPIA